MNSDKIEKQIVLKASKARVWRALTNAREFGEWFRVQLDGEFVAGRSVNGRITQPGYEHLTFELVVERMDPERLFSYRWHPYAIDTKVDYSKEPMTLVEFRLEEAEGGVLLRITESGFDNIPAARRAEAFRMNEGGWSEQLHNIERYVAG